MTYKPADMTLWRKKVLKDQAPDQRQDSFWGGRVRDLGFKSTEPYPEDSLSPLVLIGYASDEGTKRNLGRSGSVHGPLAIRRSLAGLAWHHQREVFDAGDIWCEEGQLIIAQSQLAGHIAHLLDQSCKPVILGGSRDVVWAGFQGVSRFIRSQQPEASIGVVNFGARLALAGPDGPPSAQSAFCQIAEYCQERNLDFAYYCLGLDEQVTTEAEFDLAREEGVLWRLQGDSGLSQLEEIRTEMAGFIASLDYLYLSVSLDLFSASVAPGVSAPSVFGLDAVTGLTLLRTLLHEADRAEVPVLLVDIAECNPLEDPDGRTARLAAGLVYEIARHR